ncbi:protein of unknown function [Streptomyces murinus]
MSSSFPETDSDLARHLESATSTQSANSSPTGMLLGGWPTPDAPSAPPLARRPETASASDGDSSEVPHNDDVDRYVTVGTLPLHAFNMAFP